jgi:hypothetical protein
VGLRSFTHVSYLLTAARVNAGRVKQRTLTCHFFLKRVGKHAGFNPLPVAAIGRERGPHLGSLLVAFVITFTVAGSLALGIALAYSSVIALLHAFAYSSRKPAPRLVLVASENHAGGD